MHVFHDLCAFCWLDPLHSQIKDLNWCPRDERNYSNFHEKDRVHIGSLEVRFEEQDAHKVCDCGADLDQNHLHVELVNLRVNIKDFDADEGREGDCDNVHIGVIEHDDSEENYYTSLKS